MLYIVGNVLPNTTHIHTFGHYFFSLYAVIARKHQLAMSSNSICGANPSPMLYIYVTVADDMSLSNGASAEQPTLATAGLPATAAYS